MEEKFVCSKCKAEKGRGEFVFYFDNNRQKERRRSECNECASTRRIERYWSMSAPERARLGMGNRQKYTTVEYKAIRAQRAREERANRSPKQIEMRRQWLRARTRELRDEALSHYGGFVCTHCGDMDKEVMTIDHVRNDGKQHREEGAGGGRTLHEWLKARNWPTEPPLQILCWNCNQGKRFNGGVLPPARKDLHRAVRSERDTLRGVINILLDSRTVLDHYGPGALKDTVERLLNEAQKETAHGHRRTPSPA